MACNSLLLRLLPIMGALWLLGPGTSTADATIRDRPEMVTGVDESVGRLLATLELTG